jgi:uncharacterized membrane protein
MNDVIDVPDSANQRSLKTVGHISYLLHTIVAVGAVIPGVQASVALLAVAFVLDLVKKSDAEGTWQESHFAYRIRTVLWAAALYVITSPLFLLLLLPGLLAWALVSIWFLYRIVRGWMNLNAGKAMER